MKNKLFLVFILLCVSSAYSQNKHGTNELTGFYGIEFGTSKNEVGKIMKEKGWRKNGGGKDATLGSFVTFTGGTYASKKISGFSNLFMYYINDEYYMTELYIYGKNKENLEWVNSVVDGIVKKYNLFEQKSDLKDTVTYVCDNMNLFSIKTSDNSYTLTFADLSRFGTRNNTKTIEEVANSDDL